MARITIKKITDIKVKKQKKKNNIIDKLKRAIKKIL